MNWRSNRAGDGLWPFPELYRLCQATWPDLTAAEVQARTETLVRFQAADVYHRRYSARKFRAHNVLIGGELYTDTDERGVPD